MKVFLSTCCLLTAICVSSPGRADAQATASISQGLQWRLVGPHRGGRTRAITGVPGSPHTYLAGAVNGGVWRTDDDGRTWTPIFDAQPTQSIGAIAVAPSNASILYVGSGEGLHRPDLSVGTGMYRSVDGGKRWTHLGLDDAQQIPDVAVDPQDPNRVYVAVLGHPFGPSTQRGVYRSLDGGASWQQVLRADADTGASFVRIDPFDAQTLYAGLWNVRSGPWEDKNTYNGTKGGLFKSTDGGEHWRALKEGLPADLSQIDVAVAPSARGRLYATVATSAEGEYASADGLGVYRSDDGGEHWRVASTDPRPAMRIGGGDLPIIKVDPTNADVLFSVSIVMHRSADGGATWTPFKGAPGGDDYQNLWISPEGSQRIALVSDQGTVVTVNGGRTWSSWFNQPTAQLYHIGITPTYPYRLCSGQQESGSVCISSRGNDGEITYRDWHPVGVIEYGYVLPDPLDADVIYGAGRNVVTRTHLSTGQVQNITPLPLLGADDRVTRTEPILFAPQDPHRLYVAANRLYASSDAGNSWTPISGDLARPSAGSPPSVGDQLMPKAAEQRGAIYAVSASPVSRGLLWAGTDDGFLWVTHDEGGHWQNVTPPALTPWSKITQVEASHFDGQVAYVSVSRFRIDDLRPYIYRTRDGGSSWQLVTAGLPADAAVNAVREDPARRGLLFAATENAVWMSADDGEHWSSLQLNLPHTSMRDLAIHGQDLIVATHGRGFWILDDIGPLRALAGAAHGEPVLVRPAAAIRARRSTGSDTPIPPDEPTAPNPPSGAIIDYYLPRAAKEPLSIEVLDAGGRIVRVVRSTDRAGRSPEERAREMIPAYWIREPAPLATGAGAHRFVWDLHYATPRAVHRGYPISAVPHDTPQEPEGPLAVPGDYVVRLSIGKRHWDQPLSILPDPRVAASARDFAAQYALAQQLADALDASSEKVLQAKSMRTQLKALSAQGEAASAARALDARLQALLEPQPPANGAPARGLERVNEDIARLYEQVGSADAAPTRAQSAAAARVLAECQSLLASSAGIWSQELPALNGALKKARLPAVRSEAVPEAGGQNLDEE
ncbi:MAG: glycoside hydrolase [Proteobacteria bacterium]|nr:glycoside hydrolase [Pseudomonadota bacterium]